MAEAQRFAASQPSHKVTSKSLRTCRRASDCGDAGGGGEKDSEGGGACARPVLGSGESLVAVVLGSGKVLAWRGDARRDGLAAALRPAPLQLRASASHGVRVCVETFVGAFAGPEASESRSAWGDWAVAWLVRLPAHVLAFLAVLGEVSVSIGLLNALPVYGLDGHLAATQFVRLWLLAAPPPVPHSAASPRGDSFAVPVLTAQRHSDKAPHRRGLLTVAAAADEDEATAQLLREQYHDWNALHVRQKRITAYILGSGSVLVALNVALGGLAVVM